MLVNKSTLEIVTDAHIRASLPNISFPTVLTNSALQGTTYAVLELPNTPALTEGQFLEVENIRLDEGTAKADWKVSTKTYTLQETITAFDKAITAHINLKANELGYQDIYTAISFRDDPNPVFAAEAAALFTWRSAVWTKATTDLQTALGQLAVNPSYQIPSIGSVISSLPLFSM